MTLGVLGCGGSDEEPQQPPADSRTPVAITTRGDNVVNAERLQAGLFMVNYYGGEPDQLLPTANYVNNQRLTYSNNGWTTATPIYWSDGQTPADFYAYAPYQPVVPDALHMAFSVATDQRTDEALSQSDLLWGKTEQQSAAGGAFNLEVSHVLSRLTVAVVAEAGFDEGELRAADVSVTIGGTKTAATVDLSTGAVLPEGTAADVACHSNGDLSYTAILLPQEVPFSNFIQVDWKGNAYTLQNSFKLEARKQYSLTVKLKKSKNGFDIGIAGWDIVEEDFGGVIGGN